MTIGTVLHGALGDYYEQLCAIKLLRNRYAHKQRWVAFFAEDHRIAAMRHFRLDMIDEYYSADMITNINVDKFVQFQIKDRELNDLILSKLPAEILAKFNLKKVLKPWTIIKDFDFRKSGLRLDLSTTGEGYVPVCMKENGISSEIFKNKFVIGYLWRYRESWDAINPAFQKSKSWIIQTKNELFRKLISEYNAHILICGMSRHDSTPNQTIIDADFLNSFGFRKGEYCSKYTDLSFDLPPNSCTYLRGLGYAAEMEIMSRCDLLLMMPSGFSEPLWMMRKNPVIMLDPCLDYMIKLWWNRMPFFNNLNMHYAIFNLFTSHTPEKVINFLKAQGIFPPKQKVLNNRQDIF